MRMAAILLCNNGTWIHVLYTRPRFQMPSLLHASSLQIILDLSLANEKLEVSNLHG